MIFFATEFTFLCCSLVVAPAHWRPVSHGNVHQSYCRVVSCCCNRRRPVELYCHRAYFAVRWQCSRRCRRHHRRVSRSSVAAVIVARRCVAGAVRRCWWGDRCVVGRSGCLAALVHRPVSVRVARAVVVLLCSLHPSMSCGVDIRLVLALWLCVVPPVSIPLVRVVVFVVAAVPCPRLMLDRIPLPRR